MQQLYHNFTSACNKILVHPCTKYMFVKYFWKLNSMFVLFLKTLRQRKTSYFSRQICDCPSHILVPSLGLVIISRNSFVLESIVITALLHKFFSHFHCYFIPLLIFLDFCFFLSNHFPTQSFLSCEEF